MPAIPQLWRCIMANPNWVVNHVEPKQDYTLQITFEDGSVRIYDARPLLDKPIYNPLQNIGFFMQAKAECGTVVWNDEIDIAPEHLYECSKPIENK